MSADAANDDGRPHRHGGTDFLSTNIRDESGGFSGMLGDLVRRSHTNAVGGKHWRKRVLFCYSGG